MPKLEYDAHKKITWKDIQEVVRNIKEYYDLYMIPDKAPLRLLEAIYSLYQEHMEKQPMKNINLNAEANRPKILRSEVIRRYTNEETGKELFEEYRIVKGRINRKLKECAYKEDKKLKKLLNPKGLVLAASERKGRGEESNYFVLIALSKAPALAAKDRSREVPSAPLDVLRHKLERWKSDNFSGDKTLRPPDIVRVAAAINPLDLDDEGLAFFFTSCVFMRYKYHLWWDKVKDRPEVIRHLFNLMLQAYQRPFWRAAFILQYAEPSLFNEIISEFPKRILEDEKIKTGINAIINKNVEKYLSKHKDEEVFARELLKEFSAYRRYLEEEHMLLSPTKNKKLNVSSR